MRTYDEIVRDAYKIRHELLRDGRNPEDGFCVVTAEEYRMLENNWVGALSGKKPERMCGLKLATV